MKELLSKLIKNYVDIGFKLGGKIEGAVVEAVKENVVIVTYNGGITMIEISEIAYVTMQTEIIEVVQNLLDNEENKQGEIKPEEVKPEEVKQEEINEPQVNNGQDHKKKKHHHK